MEANRGPRPPKGDRDSAALRGWIDLAVGLVLFALGAIAYTATHGDLTVSATDMIIYVLMVAGGLTAVRGVWRLARTSPTSAVPLQLERQSVGYKSFVAWRYLLVVERKVNPRVKWLLAGGFAVAAAGAAALWCGLAGTSAPLKIALWAVSLVPLAFNMAVLFWSVLRHSKPALIVGLVGLVILALSIAALKLIGRGKLPMSDFDPEAAVDLLQIANIAAIVGGVLVALAMLFGTLRAYFTFFTTVPIGGVWIGTAALVMVLSVMSGFETDLRNKILGSNAHLQITRYEGDFLDWRDIKAKIDRMPGVIASAPYATSEVVVAANNTGMNVVIKGIDPQNIGKVSDLVEDLEDRDAIKRLDPIVSDPHDLRVPQPSRPSGPGRADLIDPPPDDMPSPGDPIDFSRPAAGSADKTSAGSDSDPGAELEPPLVHAPRAAKADAPKPDAQVVDPPPSDLTVSDESPADYSRPDYAPESVVRVIDVPFDTPSLSRRTQALPGILVGRELVKQTHLYTGEEVRVVSPLSDPANPDANGTPIPFNRDYRVAGIFFTGMYEYDLKYVYVTLDTLQEFLDRGDAIDGLEVRVANPDDTDAYVARFHQEFGPEYRVQDWKELNRSLFSALKLEKVAMFFVLVIVILVASFSIVGDLIMVVVEKQREIALLKTLGASDVGVMQLFAIQGLMIGVIGTAIGIATGLLLCWAGTRFGIPVSPDVYYIDRLPIHVEPTSVVAAASAGILTSIAATLYPALVAARVRPAAGMRH